MAPRRRIIALFALVTVLVGRATNAQTGVPSDEYLRQLLNYEESGPEVIQLISYGDKAFPGYQRIIGSQNASPSLAGRVFYILQNVKADRSGFVEPAVKSLAEPEGSVRWQALRLLAQIGSLRDTPPIVALMWDDDSAIVRAAAEALTAIGGDRELMAIELWINSNSHARDPVLRHHVQRSRAELAKKVLAVKKINGK